MSLACTRCGHPEREHSGGGEHPCIGGKLMDDGCPCTGFQFAESRTCGRQGCGHPEDQHMVGDGCTRQLYPVNASQYADGKGVCPCAAFLATRETIAVFAEDPEDKRRQIRAVVMNEVLPAVNMTIRGVKHCARCGRDHDGPITARPLTQPFAPTEANGATWTHWFPCPYNFEPVLVREG